MNVLVRPGLSRTIKSGSPPPEHKRDRILTAVAVLAIVLTLVAYFVLRSLVAKEIRYITAPIVRKDLLQTVTASGTLNPQDTILIGTQVSGTITEQDADYNTVVKSGEILTRIDPTSFKAQLESAQAAHAQSLSALAASVANAGSAERNVIVARENVAAARAALASAMSQVAKTKAALSLANLTVDRDRDLLAQGFIAQAQADTDTSNAVAAQSSYDASIIAVAQARAQLAGQIASEDALIAQAESADSNARASRHAAEAQRAAVDQARYNFENTVIRSQVNGTVIARNITVGQTVAASFQTPTLFTIGRDLTKMEVDVSVGEPDIGGVRKGNAVDFTVLAYPNRTFHGVVYQVRKNPTTVNNVVTYDTVVYVQNKDGALFPGMTANASIHVAKAANALVVPITALQWAPTTPIRANSGSPHVTPVSQWGMTDVSLTRTIIAGRDGRVFLLRSGRPVRVPVHVLLVSDTEAAIGPVSEKLSANDSVVTSDSASLMASQQSPSSPALGARASQLGPPSGSQR